MEKIYSTAFITFAAEKRVKRIEWVVLDWNTQAIDFYKKERRRMFLMIGIQFKWMKMQ